MTPEEINIAIAMACGKTYHKPTEEEIASGSYYQYQPNYYCSLDEMHQAEKMLKLEQHPKYFCELQALNDWEWMATSAQRAEAFLRTLNLWRDD